MEVGSELSCSSPATLQVPLIIELTCFEEQFIGREGEGGESLFKFIIRMFVEYNLKMVETLVETNSI